MLHNLNNCTDRENHARHSHEFEEETGFLGNPQKCLGCGEGPWHPNHADKPWKARIVYYYEFEPAESPAEVMENLRNGLVHFAAPMRVEIQDIGGRILESSSDW